MLTLREILCISIGFYLAASLFTFWIKWHTWPQKDRVTRFILAFLGALFWWAVLPIDCIPPHYGGNQHPLDKQREWSEE